MASTSTGGPAPRATVLSASKAHTATAIFCHGLGQSTAFLEFDVQFLARRLPFVKWILPQARERAVSLNAGEYRPSWFNIWHLPPLVNEFDEASIADSVSLVERLILNEVHSGLDPKKILLVGFSQGAALCLMTALTTLHDIGGVASLSGWIPHLSRNVCHLAGSYLTERPQHSRLLGAWKVDTEIPLRYARNSIEFLEQRLHMTEEMLCYNEYAGLGHEITEEVLIDLAHWARAVLCS